MRAQLSRASRCILLPRRAHAHAGQNHFQFAYSNKLATPTRASHRHPPSRPTHIKHKMRFIGLSARARAGWLSTSSSTLLPARRRCAGFICAVLLRALCRFHYAPRRPQKNRAEASSQHRTAPAPNDANHRATNAHAIAPRKNRIAPKLFKIGAIKLNKLSCTRARARARTQQRQQQQPQHSMRGG